MAEEIRGTLSDGVGGTSGETQEREEEFVFDPEEAAVCLTCPRARCRLDENKACLRYRRRIRALRARRAERSVGIRKEKEAEA